MNNLFVFDLDDTLIDNVHDYADPILDACKLIVHTLGNKAPHVTKIITLEQEIDKRKVEEINPSTGSPYLFSMERFPGSLVEVYRELCRYSGLSPNKEIEIKLYDIGMTAFDDGRYLENVNPYVHEVLGFLRQNNDQLILCTKGDRRVQERKIRALRDSGVDITHFREILIVDKKDTELFSAIKRGHETYSCYSVGNSYQSDIVPALEAGYKGIYIPVETWEILGQMDKILGQIDYGKVIVLQTIKDLILDYARLR